ncbi:MAG TPA: TFIIB-type zinc ribbon-containing protein, partial [Nitrososphaeraceae archaeon]|nr:TFIIB-type zinc ribbon-containing protein [Nitrososphaeraceae archaeon]
MLNSSESIKCSVCGRMYTAITDPESGEEICSNCGLVIAEKDIDLANPERRIFTTEESNQRARIGAPTSLSRHDRGLPTLMGKPTRDAAGQKLDASARLTYKRLKTWDDRERLHSSTDKNLSRAFSELYMLRDKLGLSASLVEEIAYMYRKVEDRGIVRGRTIRGMLVACVYLACRKSGNPRTLKDVSAKSNINRKDIAKNCRLVMRELGITSPVVDPMKCIVRVANAAQMSEKTTRRAFRMMSELLRKKTLTAGKDPMGLAASILYIATKETGETKTQIDMARASGVT